MGTPANPHFYQAGGSLSRDFPAYVSRPADNLLYEYLKAGEFCYVLTARQMGKSSLRVRTMDKLQAEGYLCVAVDITSIGSHNTTVDQWYYSFLYQLVSGLGLQVDYRSWWKGYMDLTPINRMQYFWEEILLPFTDKPVIIFLDEIDSVLSLDRDQFSTDDFFAAFRATYNQRAADPAYERLRFAVFGVAMPNDLMQDPERTPFNIGESIPLLNFQTDDAFVLTQGLSHIQADLREVLEWVMSWTNGQPYLTQKLFKSLSTVEDWQNPRMVVEAKVEALFLQPELLDSDPNLSSVQKRILLNEKWNTSMLDMYSRLFKGQSLNIDNRNPAHLYLKLSGLVQDAKGKLQISNKIYETVFDENWIRYGYLQVERPFAKELKAWLDDERSSARLMKGQYLHDNLEWAEGREDLSIPEREFLEASRIAEVEEVAEIKRLKEREKQRKYLIIALVFTLALLVASILFAQLAQRNKDEADKNAILFQEQAEVADSQKNVAQAATLRAQESEKQAIAERNRAERSRALAERAQKEERRLRLLAEELQIQTDEQRDSIAQQLLIGKANLIQIVAQEILPTDPTLSYRLFNYARNTFYDDPNIKNIERDLLAEHSLYKRIPPIPGNNQNVFTSQQEGAFWYTAEEEEGYVLYFWNGEVQQSAQKVGTIPSAVLSLQESKSGKFLVTGLTNHKAQIWDLQEGKLTTELPHQGDVGCISISQDGKWIATGSLDNYIRIWDTEGTLQKTSAAMRGDLTSLHFSPDGKQVLAGSSDNGVYLWKWQAPSGEPIEIGSHQDDILAVSFLPNGQMASVGVDRQTLFWDLEETGPVSAIRHDLSFLDVRFSEDGQFLYAIEEDGNMEVWDVMENTSLLLENALGLSWDRLSMHADGKYLVSISAEGEVYRWLIKPEALSELQLAEEIGDLSELCETTTRDVLIFLTERSLTDLLPEYCLE
ncbi:MAG: AAA-like domain-containing protein [Bacteroidota bacterium]